ncbi:MAG: carboxyl transferase domain-containing protein [Oscillospiraceae bacterium]|jgi:acetyl-CoA carboxylase carboxyltransferase component
MACGSTIAKLAAMKSDILKASPARERLTNLYDEGIFTELDTFAKTGEALTGVITAFGYVEGTPVYAFSQDSTVNDGAVGEAQTKKISKLYDMAAKTGCPVVGIYDSYGVVVTDGVKALSAYGELLMRTSNLSGVVPQIAVIAGTCAGTAAMIAASADFVVMSKDAELFITPNSKSAVGSYAENSAKCGTVSLVCENDAEAVKTAKILVSKLPMNNITPVPMFEFEQSAAEMNGDAASITAAIADAGSVIELSPDFGTAAYTALASMGGATVGIAATNKTASKLTADDCSKLARFVRTCDAFGISVITIVDTEGFELSDEAEISGSLRDMTKLASAYAEATTAKISLISGKAYGSAYIALAGKSANADTVIAFADAVISPLAPETAVEFLMHDKLKGADDVDKKRRELAAEYAENEASVFIAAEQGCIDNIIEPSQARASLLAALDMLSGKRVSTLPKKHSNMPL